MSYISPIKIGYAAEPEEGWTDKIGKYMAGEVDNLVLESCVKVGCHVDKDELEKALRYDRGQYEKGYADGKRDAADAIEELKDMPWVESVQIDKLRQRIDELEETACHCNVRENAELIAKILDDDVDGKVYQMPKRGEIVRCGECVHCYAEGFAHERNICEKHPELGNVPDDWFCADGEREVQDESQNNRSYRE